MKKVLILFAHPKFEQSRTNRLLIDAASKVNDVTVHDLYENYPDFNINLSHEKELLNAHDVIIWHHPFYWYSCPPLLKQWIDIVLEYNWAYGPEGHALDGKMILNALTAGGARHAYTAEGKNYYPIQEFLRPFEQTARLCRMEYLPPFAVLGTHRQNAESLADYQNQYVSMLNALKAGALRGIDYNAHEFLNDLELINNTKTI